MSDLLKEAIDTLSELKRLHQLNYELLEQLNVACQYITDSGIDIPNKEKVKFLLGKSIALINEIQADEPKTLPYKTLSRRKVTWTPDRQQGNRTRLKVLLLLRQPIHHVVNCRFRLASPCKLSRLSRSSLCCLYAEVTNT